MSRLARPHDRSSLARDLRALGCAVGDTLMIHASMRRVGSVDAGADTLIDALLEVVGAEGTLFAYADFETTPSMPFFDADHSPCAVDHGVFPEVLRRRRGTRRSVNPGASVIALGAKADGLVAPHRLIDGYGLDTPFARFVAERGQILLIGSLWDAVTLLHHAEAIARIPGKRCCRHEIDVRIGDRMSSVVTEEWDTSHPVHPSMPEDYFERLVTGFVGSHVVPRGPVGHADTVRLDARALLEWSVAQIEAEYGDPAVTHSER